MPVKKIRAFSNCDETTIVWQTKAPIKDCRGFALEREVKGKTGTTFLPTWVGFKGEKHAKGQKEPSTKWPIQRYIWSDYDAQQGTTVRYRAVPMIGPAGALDKAPKAEWSPWTKWLTVGTGQTPGFEAYFNRGIAGAQWLARQRPTQKSLQADINNPDSKNRKMLSGELRIALLRLLASAWDRGTEVYAALFELDDPELTAALDTLGGKCHLLLASGAYKAEDKKKHTPAEPDENEPVRKALRADSKVNVYDRLVKSPHFAHNKFVVFCNKQGAPEEVWTGSTNWTVNGLCTQVNNGVLIRIPAVAEAYLARWKELKDAGAQYPKQLSTDGCTPAVAKLGRVSVTAWQAPNIDAPDLAQAAARILAAKQGVLFLMFNPGIRNTLLNTILSLDPEQLFIHGVVNQDPGGKRAPLLKLTHKGKQLSAPMEAITPAALKAARNWFDKSFTYNRVMIHSKVVIVDPFGSEPVVITGSHNLGPKASAENDDNLVIIEHAPGLASEYAVNLLGVYGHYKWLYNQSLAAKKGTKTGARTSPQYDGNFDNDSWQEWYTGGINLREINFWMG